MCMDGWVVISELPYQMSTERERAIKDLSPSGQIIFYLLTKQNEMC